VWPASPVLDPGEHFLHVGSICSIGSLMFFHQSFPLFLEVSPLLPCIGHHPKIGVGLLRMTLRLNDRHVRSFQCANRPTQTAAQPLKTQWLVPTSTGAVRNLTPQPAAISGHNLLQSPFGRPR